MLKIKGKKKNYAIYFMFSFLEQNFYALPICKKYKYSFSENEY